MQNLIVGLITGFIIGGCFSFVTIAFLMGARPDSPQKRMEDAEWLREYMDGQNNPCTTCYFDWKDYCDSDRRRACAEKAAKERKDAKRKHAVRCKG